MNGAGDTPRVKAKHYLSIIVVQLVVLQEIISQNLICMPHYCFDESWLTQIDNNNNNNNNNNNTLFRIHES